MKSILALALIATLMACTPEATPEGTTTGGAPREMSNNEKEK